MTARGIGSAAWVALVLAGVGVASCGGEGPARATEFESLPVLTATEQARWGDADDPDRGFTRIAGVEVDREGRVYVVEGSVPEVRVFDPDGNRLATIGRRGEGPGEFEAPPTIHLTGDTLGAIHAAGRRLARFDSAGTLLGTALTEGVQVLLPGAVGTILPREPLGGGLLRGDFVWIATATEETGVAPTDSIPWPLVRFSWDGEVVDTLGWWPNAPPRMWRPPAEEPEVRMIRVGGRPFLVPSPPVLLPRWLMVEVDRVVVATPAPTGARAAIVFTRIDLDRDTVFHTVLDLPARRHSADQLDSIAHAAARTGGFAPASGTPGAPAADNADAVAALLRREMSFPDFSTPLDRSWSDGDGAIWTRVALDDGSGDATWVIVESDGRFRGRLALPPTLAPLWARGDVLWASTTDGWGIPWLVRYRIGPR